MLPGRVGESIADRDACDPAGGERDRPEGDLAGGSLPLLSSASCSACPSLVVLGELARRGGERLPEATGEMDVEASRDESDVVELEDGRERLGS